MRKLFLAVVVIAAAIGGAGYYFFHTHPEAAPAELLDAATGYLTSSLDYAKHVTQRISAPPQPGAPATSTKKTTTSSAAASKPAAPSYQPKNLVTLYLTNGGTVTGDLVEDTPERVTLRWEYGDVSFTRQEIKRQVGGKATEGEDITLPASATEARAWRYRHDVVFRLLNGTILDAKLSRVTPAELVLLHTLEGGGTMEQTLARDQLDEVMFRPVENERSKQIRAYLETTFPKMHFYDEGAFTIVTDSIAPTVKGYRREIRQLVADYYLTFYPLLNGRTLATQQYLVIFDNWPDFITYAQTDGVPGWAVGGYFSPQHEVLYLFNMMGEWFSDFLYEAFLGRARQSVDGAVDQAKGAYGNRYDETFEGLGLEIKAKFERADALIRAGYRQVTEDTLRHELTHSLFHGFGLQTVVLSQTAQNLDEEAKKKREFLGSADMEKRRQLLMELLNTQGREPIEIRAANSWVSEGLAAYMERAPIGAPHDLYLYLVQRARQDKQLLPAEFLNVFRMGSFPGIAPKAMYYAYAQSWCFVRFLMERSPAQFLAYLQDYARDPSRQMEEIDGLLKALGTDILTLNAEFTRYVEQLPEQVNPWIVQYEAFRDIFSRF